MRDKVLEKIGKGEDGSPPFFHFLVFYTYRRSLDKTLSILHGISKSFKCIHKKLIESMIEYDHDQISEIILDNNIF